MRAFRPGTLRILALTMLLLGALVACGGESGPLAVDSVTFKQADASGNPGGTVTTFAPSDHKLFAEAKLNQTVTGFSGKAVWTAVDTTAGQNVSVAEVEFSGLAGNVLTANVSLPNDWPTGTYKVDFYQGDTLLKSQEFKIQ